MPTSTTVEKARSRPSTALGVDATSGRWDGSTMPSLEGKIVVITGANTGIGFATAVAMAAKSAHVILACRSHERGLQAEMEIRKTTGNPSVEFMQLDVGSLASIRAFVAQYQSRLHHLDILVNNAGVMHPAQTETVDGFEAHFGVNHLGHFYLTSLLMDSLKCAQDEARIVVVSSTNHRYVSAETDFASLGRETSGSKYMNEYSVSKLCNLLFLYELDRRLRRTAHEATMKIKVVGCHPGITLTNITTHAVKADRLPAWIQSAFNTIVSALPIFQTPEIGALPTLYAATHPGIESGDYIGPNGWRAFWGYPTKDESSPLSHSQQAATQLWTRSEELLKVPFDLEESTQ